MPRPLEPKNPVDMIRHDYKSVGTGSGIVNGNLSPACFDDLGGSVWLHRIPQDPTEDACPTRAAHGYEVRALG